MNNISDVVLGVDDSPESLGMLNVALNTQGFTALVALNGIQALAIVEKVKPDVVLLDAVMPEMDGFSACRQITTNDDTKDIPVVIVSSKKEEADKVWAQLQGAAAMIAKPFTEDDLLVQINALA